MPLQPKDVVGSDHPMPCAREIHEDAKLELAAELLRNGGAIRLQALGTSMLPTIWPGDVVSIENRRGKEIAPGDLVLVARDHKFFIHRLVEQLSSHWITRGDSLPRNDVPVDEAHVLGRVSVIHRKAGAVIPKRQVPLLFRLLAWMLSRSDTFRKLVLHTHWLCQRVRSRSFPVASKLAPLQQHE